MSQRPGSTAPAVRRRPSLRAGGFTLVEAMVVVAIGGVLAAMSIGALSKLKTNGAYAAGVNDVLGALRQTRAEAFGRGAPAVFVVDTVGNRWWSIADLDANFTLDAFSPTAPATAPDVLVLSGTLPTGVVFGPDSGFGTTLPAPYAVVPASTKCSFCRTAGTNAGFGAVMFRPGGGALLSDGSARGGSITLRSTLTGRKPLTLVVNARSGATQTFERTTP